jgi:hypothetical protein
VNEDNAELLGHDQYLVEIENIQREMEGAWAGSDPFIRHMPAPGTVLCDSEDHLLGVTPSGVPVGFSLKALSHGVCVAGPPGSGKTTVVVQLMVTAAESGRCVLAIDQQEELRGLLGIPRTASYTRVLSIRDIQFSLYQPVGGMAQGPWASMTTDTLARGMGRLYAGRPFHALIQPLLRPDRGIALSQLRRIARNRIFPADRRRAELISSMDMALETMQTHLHGVFEYVQSDMVSRLVEQPGIMIVESGRIPHEVVQTTVDLVLNVGVALRRLGETTGLPPFFLVMEDATSLVDRSWDEGSLSGTTTFTQHQLLDRKLGMECLVVTHSLERMSDALRANIETVVLTSTRGMSARFLRDTYGLTDDQAEFGRMMPIGTALAYVPSKWPAWIPLIVPPIQLPQVSDDTCLRSAQEFLRSTQSTRYVESTVVDDVPERGPSSRAPAHRVGEAQSADQPQDREFQLLIVLASDAAITLTEAYAKARLTRAEGAVVSRVLRDRQLIAFHRLPTGRRGAPLSVAELMDAGWDLLRARGLSGPPARLTHGGFRHNLAAQLLERRGKARRSRMLFEQQVGSVRVDVVEHLTDGSQRLYQIGISDPDREAQAISSLASQPDVPQIILVVPDDRFAEAVRRRLRQIDDSSNDRFTTELIGAIAVQQKH